MKTKFFYIILTTVISLSSTSVFAGGAKGKKVSSHNKNTTISHLIISVKEVEMEMESWMTSLGDCNAQDNLILDESTQDKWISKDLIFNKKTESIQESKLIPDGWMLESFDSKTQEIFTDEELELESWMYEAL